MTKVEQILISETSKSFLYALQEQGTVVPQISAPLIGLTNNQLLDIHLRYARPIIKKRITFQQFVITCLLTGYQRFIYRYKVLKIQARQCAIMPSLNENFKLACCLVTVKLTKTCLPYLRSFTLTTKTIIDVTTIYSIDAI